MKENIEKKVRSARKAFLEISISSTAMRNNALRTLASGLRNARRGIMAANRNDAALAVKSGLQASLLKRLELNDEKFSDIVHEVLSVEKQPELAGRVSEKIVLDKGLVLEKVSVPMGVICAIFESRPDALVQIAALSIKTGNAAILKGGSEALNTNRALARVVRAALFSTGLPQDAIQLVESRESVKGLLGMNEHIDLIIPRGSSAFVKFIQQNSSIPVLGHSDGICHEYVDEHALLEKAVRICVDAKTQYPAVCNAMETLLAHRNVAKTFLPMYAEALGGKVELRCDPESFSILRKAGFAAKKAVGKDWRTEYNDLILSVRVVKSLDEAIRHVNEYGSKHTDGIISENRNNAEEFMARVDSAGVFWNASTRFADGYRYGKGAEVGISTGKIHARGPSGAEALLTHKYVLRGEGHVVADYSGSGAKKFVHRRIRC